METTQQRIEQAWSQCQDWIGEFDGSPSQAFLLRIPPAAVVPALTDLSTRVEDLRLSAIPAGSSAQADFFALTEAPSNLERLTKGELAELHVNYALRQPDFDLDLHGILEPMEDGTLSLEIVWWADQVFSVEVDTHQQFTALANYFIEQQKLFQAATLLVSQEIGAIAGQDPQNGVEI